MHLADVVIQRSAPHVIESDWRGAGRSHPGSGVSWIICIDRADNYLDAFGGSHGGHTLQVVTGIAGIALNKVVPPSHDDNGPGRRNRVASERESSVALKSVADVA